MSQVTLVVDKKYTVFFTQLFANEGIDQLQLNDRVE